MATQAQLTIRREAAYARIEAAANQLAKAIGANEETSLGLRHRDPGIEHALRVEAVADALEALVKAQAKEAASGATETAKPKGKAKL